MTPRSVQPANVGLSLSDAGLPEPASGVILPPRARRARLAVLRDVQFDRRTGRSEPLVHFEDDVIIGDVVNGEIGGHALHIGPTRPRSCLKSTGQRDDLGGCGPLRGASGVLACERQTIESLPLPGEGPGSLERFVLDHCHEYVSQRLTKDEDRVVAAAMVEYHAIHKAFEWRHCFTNSQGLLACDEARAMIYVEGFAWTHALRPVLHGWLSINGKVIDVTLPPRTRREAKLEEPLHVLGQFDGRSYLSVPFLRSYVDRRRRTTCGHGSLLDDAEHEYPLLRNGPKGAVRRKFR
jgi:hypothetical protein